MAMVAKISLQTIPGCTLALEVPLLCVAQYVENHWVCRAVL